MSDGTAAALRYVELAKEIVLRHLDLDQFSVFLFGSRAIGNSTRSSDIDVGIWGHHSVPLRVLSEIREALEESLVPFEVDLVDFALAEDSLKRVALQKVIVWNKPAHSLLS